ncbi:hypothetical protein RFI_32236 [Reticulomyxa filosa]|uniref:Uncharacterized protein n=1 Tax=Reticulomyxa filosa TaxID=46433 RepID=X6LWQ3_RETFI|nr:hypothetical protein RFI_32236 [Reticulomyxa filosa]|eukprot:ETO05160.1 hypothetical protein RFI_32236 [Reticulomyxa filosa]
MNQDSPMDDSKSFICIQPNKIDMDKFVMSNDADDVNEANEFGSLAFAGKDDTEAATELPDFCGNMGNDFLTNKDDPCLFSLESINIGTYAGLSSPAIRVPIEIETTTMTTMTQVHSHKVDNDNDNQISTDSVKVKIENENEHENGHGYNTNEHDNDNNNDNDNDNKHNNETEDIKQQIDAEPEPIVEVKKEECNPKGRQNDPEALEDAKELNALKCHMDFDNMAFTNEQEKNREDDPTSLQMLPTLTSRKRVCSKLTPTHEHRKSASKRTRLPPSTDQDEHLTLRFESDEIATTP